MSTVGLDALVGAADAVWVGAALELGIFEILALDHPSEIDGVARACALDRVATSALLSGLASLGLVEWLGDGRIGLTSAGARLWSGHDRTLRHLGLFVHRVLRPLWTEAVTPGARPRGDIAEVAAGQGQLDVFARAMHESAMEWFVRSGLIDELAVPTEGVLVDLGGAPGTVAAELCRRHPGLRVTVVDRSWCLDAGRFVLDTLPPDRVLTHPGELADPVTFATLTEPTEAMTAVRVSASLDDSELTALLRRCREVLPDHGTVSLLDVRVATHDHPATASALAEMVACGARVRPVEEVARLAAAAGFRARADVRYDQPWNVVVLEVA